MFLIMGKYVFVAKKQKVKFDTEECADVCVELKLSYGV